MKVTNGEHVIDVEPVDFKELKEHGYTEYCSEKHDQEKRETEEEVVKPKRRRKKAE